MGVRSSAALQDWTHLGADLQYELRQQWMPPQPLQIRCTVREERFLVLAEHLLHVEPDPEETFVGLERAIQQILPQLIRDQSARPPAEVAVQLFLRIAGYQQPYASRTFQVDLSPTPIAPLITPEPVATPIALDEPPIAAASPPEPVVVPEPPEVLVPPTVPPATETAPSIESALTEATPTPIEPSLLESRSESPAVETPVSETLVSETLVSETATRELELQESADQLLEQSVHQRDQLEQLDDQVGQPEITAPEISEPVGELTSEEASEETSENLATRETETAAAAIVQPMTSELPVSQPTIDGLDDGLDGELNGGLDDRSEPPELDLLELETAEPGIGTPTGSQPEFVTEIDALEHEFDDELEHYSEDAPEAVDPIPSSESNPSEIDRFDRLEDAANAVESSRSESWSESWSELTLDEPIRAELDRPLGIDQPSAPPLITSLEPEVLEPEIEPEIASINESINELANEPVNKPTIEPQSSETLTFEALFSVDSDTEAISSDQSASELSLDRSSDPSSDAFLQPDAIAPNLEIDQLAVNQPLGTNDTAFIEPFIESFIESSPPIEQAFTDVELPIDPAAEQSEAASIEALLDEQVVSSQPVQEVEQPELAEPVLSFEPTAEPTAEPTDLIEATPDIKQSETTETPETPTTTETAEFIEPDSFSALDNQTESIGFVESVALDPIELEPVASEPVNLEPVDLEPIDLEPIDLDQHIEPIDLDQHIDPVDLDQYIDPVDTNSPIDLTEEFNLTDQVNSIEDIESIESINQTESIDLDLTELIDQAETVDLTEQSESAAIDDSPDVWTVPSPDVLLNTWLNSQTAQSDLPEFAEPIDPDSFFTEALLPDDSVEIDSIETVGVLPLEHTIWAASDALPENSIELDSIELESSTGIEAASELSEAEAAEIWAESDLLPDDSIEIDSFVTADDLPEAEPDLWAEPDTLPDDSVEIDSFVTASGLFDQDAIDRVENRSEEHYEDISDNQVDDALEQAESTTEPPIDALPQPIDWVELDILPEDSIDGGIDTADELPIELQNLANLPQPPLASTEVEIPVSLHADVDQDQASNQQASSQTEDLKHSEDSAVSKAAPEIVSEAVSEAVSEKVKPHWSPAALALVGVVATLLGAGGLYMLTRPCVIGSCKPLQQARSLSQTAIQTAQTTDSALAVVEAHQQLSEASYLLGTIPAWSPYYNEAQAVLNSYEDQAVALGQVVDALEQANVAAQRSQNPPHPLPEWREIRWIWRDAIEELEKIPPENPLYGLVQRKLGEYRANLDGINQRIAIEQQAQDRITAARKIEQLAAARASAATSPSNWQETASTWTTAIEQLQQVPQGTMAHDEAQQLLAIYQPQLTEANLKRAQEQTAESAYTQAINTAKQAQALEQQGQWIQAATGWQNALTYARQVPNSSTYYSQTQTLIGSYTQALQQAQQNSQRSVAVQTAKPSLDQACNGSPPLCSYTLSPQSVRVQFTDDYAQTVAALINQTPGNQNASTAVVNQVNRLLRSLADISDVTQVPIELYDAKGTQLGIYTPALSGYVPRQ